jgi:hypothetical protein
MALTKVGPSGFDNISTDKIATDAITEAKIADAAIENEHLNTNIISGQSELTETAEATDAILIYDISTGTLKKINVINVNLGNPTITSITPTNVDSKDSATTTTFIVTGTNFYNGVTAKLISNSAVDISFTTVTRDSNTQLTCVLNNGLITGDGLTDEPYDIFVNNGIGTTTLANQIYVDQKPVWVTASGSLGSVTEGQSANFTVEATDPESAGAIRYDVISGELPSGLSLNTATGSITGTAPTVTGDTTSTFTIQASDVDSNVSFREFSITVSDIVIVSFTSSGTFSVPVGKTSVDVLVVAGGGGGGAGSGGGGGAGGLIFRPGFPVTPGGTVTVTVGCGGCGSGTSASPTTPAYPSRPAANNIPGVSGQDSVFGTLTAKGGGAGGGKSPAPQSGPGGGTPGGSGGGGGACGGVQGGPSTATQPTQPGDSGTYGFGFAGGGGRYNATPGQGYLPEGGGGGGGGAGAIGGTAAPQPACTGNYQNYGGGGGIGKTYTIADGTTPVYYAGGGGGGASRGPGCYAAPSNPGPGGQGGGGKGANHGPTFGGQPGSVSPSPATQGQANTGGGGGGGAGVPGDNTVGKRGGERGGKGIVIVKY